jgi:hypothetical protein
MRLHGPLADVECALGAVAAIQTPEGVAGLPFGV